MFAWMAHWIVWFLIRAAGTLACVYTIWNLVNSEGYRVGFKSMLLASICAIVAIRMWMPSYPKDKSER